MRLAGYDDGSWYRGVTPALARGGLLGEKSGGRGRVGEQEECRLAWRSRGDEDWAGNAFDVAEAAAAAAAFVSSEGGKGINFPLKYCVHRVHCVQHCVCMEWVRPACSQRGELDRDVM